MIKLKCGNGEELYFNGDQILRVQYSPPAEHLTESVDEQTGKVHLIPKMYQDKMEITFADGTRLSVTGHDAMNLKAILDGATQ